MGGFLRGGWARVRHCRVRWRERLFVISRFVCVEGPVVVRRSLAMVSHGWPVIRHPSEILLVVVLRPELIGSSTLGIVVVPAERKWMDGDQFLKESLATAARCIVANSSQPFWDEREFTCHNNLGDLCGLGHCCTVRMASCGRDYLVCSSQSSGEALHEIADPHSGGPCTSAARTGDAAPHPTSGCCCHRSWTFDPSAILLGLQWGKHQ